MGTLSPLLTVMTDVAARAGRSLTRDFRDIEHLQVSRKGPADFVSVADHKAEDIIFDRLSQARPGYGFLMEERGIVEGSDKSHRWIVDPLDGTLNFLHGMPHFAVSIALEREGELVAGVIYNPATDEMFHAALMEVSRGSRRVHNSGHWTQAGACVSQFEMHLRAVAKLPIKAPEVRGHSVMINLIGIERDTRWMAIPSTQCYWYGKDVRPGRKLGHININHPQLSAVSTALEALKQQLPENYGPVFDWVCTQLK